MRQVRLRRVDVTDLSAGTWRELFLRRVDATPVLRPIDGAPVSGLELVDRAAALARWLEELGVEETEPVPALLTAGVGAMALTVAGALWDRPIAPLGPRLSPDEVAHCVRGLDARILVTEPEHVALARAVSERTRARVEILPDGSGQRERPIAAQVSADSVVGYLHTSGTTGFPKAVPMREGRLARRVEQNATALGVGPGTVYATAAGFHHIAGLGMILVVLGAGGAIAPLRSFSVDSWRGLAGGNPPPTHALLVPSQLEMLLQAGALELGGLEVLQYGASPVHPDTLRAALAALPRTRFLQIYGQTEGSPITMLDHDDHLRAVAGEPALLASNGRPVHGLDLELVDPDEAGVGEIRARAPHLFSPGDDGWLATGDLGRLDREGYLFLTGRRGEKIIRGGENVYPLEVERVLESHPAIVEAAVFGIPDRRLGERIAALVVIAPNAHAPSDADLVAWCRARLSHFKVPEVWTFGEALPRNAAGKLLRRELDHGTRRA